MATSFLGFTAELCSAFVRRDQAPLSQPLNISPQHYGLALGWYYADDDCCSSEHSAQKCLVVYSESTIPYILLSLSSESIFFKPRFFFFLEQYVLSAWRPCIQRSVCLSTSCLNTFTKGGLSVCVYTSKMFQVFLSCRIFICNLNCRILKNGKCCEIMRVW